MIPPRPEPVTAGKHVCECGEAFPFRADLARHRQAENHYTDDEGNPDDRPDTDPAA